MIIEILEYPNPILHKVAKRVEKIDDSILELLDDMYETMQANNGAGIAAPQIGVSLQVAIVDIEKPRGDESPDYTHIGKFELINPQIIDYDGDIEREEGCLSVPNFWFTMKRHRRITVQYLNRKGKEEILKAEGLLAVAIQQELDHLDGKLIIDNVSRLKRDLYLRKLLKEKKREKQK